MRAADLVTASLVMLLGGVVLYDAVRLGVGWGTDGPQSGFFPFWLAVVMVVTCAGILVQSTSRGPGQPFVTRARLVPVLKVLVPVAAFVVLTDPPGPPPGLGLYVAGAIYLAFYMRWVGGHSWLSVLAVSVGFPLITFIVFERWFLVPLPKGPLETWLGF